MKGDASDTSLRFVLIVACGAVQSCASSRPARAVPPQLEQYAALYQEDDTQAAAEQYRRECPGPEPDRQSANVSDGVNRCEARALAQAYQYADLGVGCGAVGFPVRRGSLWLVPAYVGVAGSPTVPIEVSATTGETGLTAPDTK